MGFYPKLLVESGRRVTPVAGMDHPRMEIFSKSVGGDSYPSQG